MFGRGRLGIGQFSGIIQPKGICIHIPVLLYTRMEDMVMWGWHREDTDSYSGGMGGFSSPKVSLLTWGWVGCHRVT